LERQLVAQLSWLPVAMFGLFLYAVPASDEHPEFFGLVVFFNLLLAILFLARSIFLALPRAK